MKKEKPTRFDREQQIRLMAMKAGNRGITWRDVARAWRSHHGVVSTFLSQMHKEEKLVRLKTKRANASVYVLAEHVDGRTVAAHGRKKKPCPHCGKMPDEVK